MIYFFTFRKIAQEVEISRQQAKTLQAQFDRAEAERKQRFDPVVVVKVCRFKGHTVNQMRITCTVYNAGLEAIKVRRFRFRLNREDHWMNSLDFDIGPKQDDEITLDVSASSYSAMVGSEGPRGDIQTECECESADGRIFGRQDFWNVYTSDRENDHLRGSYKP